MVTSSQQDSASPLDGLLPDENPPDLDDPARLQVGGRIYSPEEIMASLSPHLTPERIARIEAVVARRTRSVAVVVEGLANAGNVSAVMRSAEAMGFLPFHVVLGDVRYKTSKRTTQGADKWLDVYRWEDPSACARYLRARGYRLIATHLDDATPIGEIAFAGQRTALVFGNEREGLSAAMLEECDERMVIPIQGFVQSFNISVAAALALYHVHRERAGVGGTGGDLTPHEQAVLKADYCVRSLGASDQILQRALRQSD